MVTVWFGVKEEVARIVRRIFEELKMNWIGLIEGEKTAEGCWSTIGCKLCDHVIWRVTDGM